MMRTLFRIAAVLSFALVAAFGVANSAVAQNVTDAEAYANVVPCLDESCDNVDPAGMEGVVITSIDAAGAEIDSCAVEVFPASGMHGCVITKHAGDGSYAVSNMTAGYALLDEAPEVLESESHGTQLVWYAAPIGEDDSALPVSEVPDVGVGIGDQTDLLAAAAFGIALLGVSATAMRRYGRE